MKWEYKIASTTIPLFMENEGKENERKRETKAFLNRYGRIGWELVTITTKESDGMENMEAIFKRQKPE